MDCKTAERPPSGVPRQVQVQLARARGPLIPILPYYLPDGSSGQHLVTRARYFALAFAARQAVIFLLGVVSVMRAVTSVCVASPGPLIQRRVGALPAPA